jgi:hypothetical protein
MKNTSKTTHSKTSNEHLNDVVFHFNPYTQTWRCCNREHMTEMFNGNKTNVIESKKIEVLLGLLARYGSITNINEKLKNDTL